MTRRKAQLNAVSRSLYAFILHFDVCVALRADRYILNFAVAKLFQKLYIIERSFWQIARFAAFGNVAVPTLNLFEHGLALVQNVCEREFVYYLSVKRVVRANFYLFLIA